jgi:hypothetical protein
MKQNTTDAERIARAAWWVCGWRRSMEGAVVGRVRIGRIQRTLRREGAALMRYERALRAAGVPVLRGPG